MLILFLVRDFGNRGRVEGENESYEPEWLDKEFSVVLAQAGERNRQVDVVAKVRLKNGQPQWILLHAEIQSSLEADFAARIARYNAG